MCIVETAGTDVQGHVITVPRHLGRNMEVGLASFDQPLLLEVAGLCIGQRLSLLYSVQQDDVVQRQVG